MVAERLKTRYWLILSPLPGRPLMVTHLALNEQVEASLIRFALLEGGQVSPRGEDGDGICVHDSVVRGHAKVGMLVVEEDGLAGGVDRRWYMFTAWPMPSRRVQATTEAAKVDGPGGGT